MDLIQAIRSLSELPMPVIEPLDAISGYCKQNAERNVSGISGKITEILNRLPEIEKIEDYSSISEFATGIEKEEKEFNGAVKVLAEIPAEQTDRYIEILTNHPVFGDLTAPQHIFLNKPLFEAVQYPLTEPHYTMTLGYYLQNDKNAFCSFVKTLAEMLSDLPQDFILPDIANGAFESRYEVPCLKQNEKQRGGNKEIDNLLVWDTSNGKNGFLIEIKFGAPLTNNLKAYVETGKEIVGKTPVCILLSSYPIAEADIEKKAEKNQKWHRFLWNDFLRCLNKNIRNLDLDSDYRRFLSSLWRKSLEN